MLHKALLRWMTNNIMRETRAATPAVKLSLPCTWDGMKKEKKLRRCKFTLEEEDYRDWRQKIIAVAGGSSGVPL